MSQAFTVTPARTCPKDLSVALPKRQGLTEKTGQPKTLLNLTTYPIDQSTSIPCGFHFKYHVYKYIKVIMSIFVNCDSSDSRPAGRSHLRSAIVQQQLLDRQR